MIKKVFSNIYIFLIFLLLYAPIAVLIILSFNNSKSRSKWNGFTFNWYTRLLNNESIMEALKNTLVIAFLSALIATILGVCACIVLNQTSKTFKAFFVSMTNIPLLNSDIVLGISFMLLFVALKPIGFKFGFISILLAHITFNLPYVYLTVMPRINTLNKQAYEAALDLGSTPFQAFMKITLPDLFPSILSGFLLSFTMSLDDFIITHFTAGAGVHTLSTKIYAEARKGIKPEMYALSTLMFLTVLILLVLSNKKIKIEEL